ncbi:MAG TPA: GNAT family N-acetyltransferase [Candidatus Polarisedimenticolia bacterium]|nr:GNAT family N-acetyltransferase [Candidatus Polarisedimenticolia bacterium]
MSAYRFCRTDDMRRLVEALNACWLPHFPGRAPVTLADFKRDIRERHVWCSSCMIAFDGSEPIGVMIGAKRPHATLIAAIAVRPDRMRQEHGRHLIESLSAKLEILGPKRMIAEIPESQPEAMAFFEACGFTREATLTDWVLESGTGLGGPAQGGGAPEADSGRFLVPVTVADLVANRLLDSRPEAAWDREAATLQARADRLSGVGLATVDRIEAFVLHRPTTEPGGGATIDAVGPTGVARGDDLRRLLESVLKTVGAPLRIRRLAGAELPTEWLTAWGFRPSGATFRMTQTARG